MDFEVLKKKTVRLTSSRTAAIRRKGGGQAMVSILEPTPVIMATTLMAVACS